MVFNNFNLISVILLITISCSDDRIYLTEEEKGWNPYERGQTLIFESREGQLDSIFINDVKFQFPDGVGVIHKNEILSVDASHKVTQGNRIKKIYLFSIHAGTPKKETQFEFGFSSENAKFFSGYFNFEDIAKKAEFDITVPYGELKDAIVLSNDRDYSEVSNAIRLLYWSKSKGYVKFEKYDRSIWELKEIKYQNK